MFFALQKFRQASSPRMEETLRVRKQHAHIPRDEEMLSPEGGLLKGDNSY